VCDKVNYDRIV